jgi:hypothetical protein
MACFWCEAILCSQGVCGKFSLKQFGVGLRSTTVVVSATSLVSFYLDLMHWYGILPVCRMSFVLLVFQRKFNCLLCC